MINCCKLYGILTDVQYSHTIGDIEYNKANLIVKRNNGKEDLINLKFKKFSNPYKEGDHVTLQGNLRTYRNQQDNFSELQHYVFTYFDIPEVMDSESDNDITIRGIIQQVQELRKLPNDRELLKFRIRNVMLKDDKQIVSTPYCIAFGLNAKKFNFKINDEIEFKGEIHSRSFMKVVDNNEPHFTVAHEIYFKELINEY